MSQGTGSSRRNSEVPFSGIGGSNALFLVEAKLVAQVLERAAEGLHARMLLWIHLVLVGSRVVPHGHRARAVPRTAALRSMTSTMCEFFLAHAARASVSVCSS